MAQKTATGRWKFEGLNTSDSLKSSEHIYDQRWAELASKDFDSPCDMVIAISQMQLVFHEELPKYWPRPCAENYCLGFQIPHRSRIRRRAEELHTVLPQIQTYCSAEAVSQHRQLLIDFGESNQSALTEIAKMADTLSTAATALSIATNSLATSTEAIVKRIRSPSSI